MNLKGRKFFSFFKTGNYCIMFGWRPLNIQILLVSLYCNYYFTDLEKNKFNG